jgi:hypothetical protein
MSPNLHARARDARACLTTVLACFSKPQKLVDFCGKRGIFGVRQQRGKFVLTSLNSSTANWLVTQAHQAKALMTCDCIQKP